jgi:tetratricopeptide (TPR) repeat protein
MRLAFIAAAVAATFAAALAATGGGGRPAPAPRAAEVELPPPSASTDARLAALRAAVRAEPRRADGYTLLAATELQRVRETGDASSYVRAQQAVDHALSIRPGDQGALVQRAALELSRHDFSAGLRDARAARDADPTVLKPYGALVDAQVELGRYGAARRTLQAMVDRKPDLAALTRVSYLRELHGDLQGAAAALRAAASAGGEVPESAAFVASLEGGIALQRGDLAAARRAYREALHALPGYPAAESGLARADAAAGRRGAALARLRRLVERLPLPEHVTTLAELELATGRTAAARRDLGLVRAERRLQRSAGVVVDTEAAIFEADHGSAAVAVRLARRAWGAAPSVRSADALGWALTRAGRPRDGLAWARRALALGWRDPLPRSHAGLTARAAGRPDLARSWLGEAARGAAALGPWQAARVERALRSIGLGGAASGDAGRGTASGVARPDGGAA